MVFHKGLFWDHFITIYVNDLPDVVESLMFLFADDTKLFHSIICDLDIDQLQADIDNFVEWSNYLVIKH